MNGAVSLLVQQRPSPLGRRERRGRLLDEPLLAGQRDEALRQPFRVARLLPQPHGRRRRRDRPIKLVDVVQRPCVLVEQRGTLVSAQQVAAQHLLVACDGLSVRTRERRVTCGRGTEGGHCGVIARRDGVVQDPGEVGVVAVEQHAQHPRVKLPPDAGGQRVDHRAPGQLVAERDRIGTDLQHPESLGLRDGRQVVEQGPQQRQVHPGRDDGELVEACLRVRAQPAQPGQHGVDDGGGHRLPGRGEGLGDVERVSVGQPVQRLGVDARARGQGRHRGRAQRPQHQAPHLRAGQSAEYTTQRMLPAEFVVAVGQQQDGGQVADPPADVPHDVQGRAVGPVHVLDHQHGGVRSAGQLVGHGREDGTGVGSGERIGERPPSSPGPRRGTDPARAGSAGRRRSRREPPPNHATPSRKARTRLVLPMPASPRRAPPTPDRPRPPRPRPAGRPARAPSPAGTWPRAPSWQQWMPADSATRPW